MPGTDFEHLRQRQLAFAINLDVGHLVQLADPIVPDPGPFRQARQLGFSGNPTTEFARGFGKNDVIAPLS